MSDDTLGQVTVIEDKVRYGLHWRIESNPTVPVDLYRAEHNGVTYEVIDLGWVQHLWISPDNGMPHWHKVKSFSEGMCWAAISADTFDVSTLRSNF